jgi:hypothetical protein
MVIDNLHGPIKEAMVLGDCRTFPQLFERAARMQRSIKEGSITFLRKSSNGGEGKPKNTQRTQQPTQEVTITPDQMRFKHSRMHRDNRAPGISKPSRGPGPPPNPLKNLKSLLPNRKRKTQRKLRPDPQLRTQRLRPIMILSLPGGSPGDPI